MILYAFLIYKYLTWWMWSLWCRSPTCTLQTGFLFEWARGSRYKKAIEFAQKENSLIKQIAAYLFIYMLKVWWKAWTSTNDFSTRRQVLGFRTKWWTEKCATHQLQVWQWSLSAWSCCGCFWLDACYQLLFSCGCDVEYESGTVWF